MRQGALIYDKNQDRIDIRFSLTDYYGGLHCGETFDVLIGSEWIPTRIEKAAGWFLIGIKTKALSGLLVRI